MASVSFLCTFRQISPAKRQEMCPHLAIERDCGHAMFLTSNEPPPSWLESSLRPSLHMVSPIARTSRCSVLSNQVQRWRKSLELTCEVHPEPALFELLHAQSRSYVMMENATQPGERRSPARWCPLTFCYWWCNTVESEISSRRGSLRALLSWSMWAPCVALRYVALIWSAQCARRSWLCVIQVSVRKKTRGSCQTRWSRVLLLFLFFGVTTPLDGVVEILRSKISPAPPEPHSGES